MVLYSQILVMLLTTEDVHNFILSDLMRWNTAAAAFPTLQLTVDIILLLHRRLL